MIFPYRIFLHDVSVSQSPLNVIRFNSVFCILNKFNLTIIYSILCVETGISVNGVEFLLGHTTLFCTVVDNFVHGYSANLVCEITTFEHGVIVCEANLTHTFFFHPFHLDVTHSYQSIVYSIHQLYTYQRFAAYCSGRYTVKAIDF